MLLFFRQEMGFFTGVTAASVPTRFPLQLPAQDKREENVRKMHLGIKEKKCNSEITDSSWSATCWTSRMIENAKKFIRAELCRRNESNGLRFLAFPFARSP